MTILKLEGIKVFYEMDFDHNYAEGQLTFIEEINGGEESSYWINASEKLKIEDEHRVIAVKFSKEQLLNLRDVLNGGNYIMKKTMDEFIEGEVFTQEFEKTLGLLLIKNKYTSEDIDVILKDFYFRFPPLTKFEDLLGLFITKEKLNNDIREYEDSFGIDGIKFGKVLLDNLVYIYEELHKRCHSRYREYGDKILRAELNLVK